MRFSEKQAVGIDISQQRISIAVLRNGKNGPELVKSVVAPVPEGAIRNGNIADGVLLSKAIRDIRFRNRIWTKRSAVSLFVEPAVWQIIDMPHQAPTNIRQFVQNEIKSCVSLPSRDVTLDFCGIAAGRRQQDKRVFAAAAESEKLVELVRICSRAGFDVELIEPHLLAYLRAVYGKRIAGKNKLNVLVAMLRGNILTICVLRNGVVDFIRTKEKTKSEGVDLPDDLNVWLADELSEVVKFYDIEVPENTGKWDITVFMDSAHTSIETDPQGQASPPKVDSAISPRIMEEYLKSKIQAGSVQVRTMADAYVDSPAASPAKDQKDNPSPVAIGLAMKLLSGKATQPGDLKINLMPAQVLRAKEAKKDVLIAANAVAAMLLIMVLAINGFAFMIARTTRNTISKRDAVARRDTETMMELHQRLDIRLKALSSRLERIGQISSAHRDVNWVDVFEEIRKATPGSVRITGFSSQDGTRVQIEGLAMSNDAVSLFVSLLEKSPSIDSVTLLDAHRQNEQSGVVAYQLSCKLGVRSTRIKNVG